MERGEQRPAELEINETDCELFAAARRGLSAERESAQACLPADADDPNAAVIDAGRRAAWAIALRHRGLVHIAGRKLTSLLPYHSHISSEDIESVGLAILFRCARNFDPDRGIAFSSYATTALNNGLSPALINANNALRRNSRLLGYAVAIAGFENEQLAAHGRLPDDQTLQEHFGLSPDRLQRIRETQLHLTSLSLDAVLRQPAQDTTLTFQDLQGTRYEAVAEVDKRLLWEERFNEAQSTITEAGVTPFEWQVWRLRFVGSPDGGPLSTAEVGHQLGLSRADIRQIEIVVRGKLLALAARRSPRAFATETRTVSLPVPHGSSYEYTPVTYEHGYEKDLP